MDIPNNESQQYNQQFSQEYLVILNTCPDKESATKVANSLIERQLAACVNILPGLTSVYPWKGQIETGEEVLLIIKSTRSAYEAVETAIRETHPYELPEVVAVPIVAGLQAYLSWIGESVVTDKTTSA
jgi:periplasmic divalent cation tolerance protein